MAAADAFPCVPGDQLPATVYPFLLRGITLYGIDSAKCPPSRGSPSGESY